MRYSLMTRRLLYTFIFILALFLAACSPAENNAFLAITPEGAVEVDPLFREFYDTLGGQGTLGPAISPAFPFANRKFQYTDKACLEYDPSQPDGEQFRLAALGLDLNLNEPQVPPPSDPSKAYVNGHVVFDGFLPLYRQLSSKYVGDPLSEVHYNAEMRRYEQYFANVGFYWNEDEPAENARLLSYGAWKCDANCRFVPDQNAKVDVEVIAASPSDETFRQAAVRLGSDLTGFPLSAPYTAPDGMVEKIYENVVLAYDPSSPSSIFLRPLPVSVGVLQGPMETVSKMEGMTFWPLDGELGYNVPQPFIDYMTAHGGIPIFGSPVEKLDVSGNPVFKQCFTNLCLEYHLRTNVPQQLRIRPTALGYLYRDIRTRLQNNTIDTESMHSITLQVWEKYQYISFDQEQEIGAAVFDGTTPLEQVVPMLVVTFPDGSQGSFYFPPTASNGITLFKLSPIDAGKGTIVPYQVCVSMLEQDLFCVKDSFVIWYNP